MARDRVSQLRDLLSHRGDLEEKARELQTGQPGQARIEAKQFRDQYRTWYNHAVTLLEGDEKTNFTKCFNGTTFTPGIKKFIESPTEENVLVTQAQVPPPFPVPPWLWEVERSFISNFSQQCDILEQQVFQIDNSEAGTTDTLEQLGRSFRRFPSVVNILGRPNKNGPGLHIEDEYDLQRIVGGILFSMFDDVRAEDPTEQFAGGSSRIDFILKRENIAIEVKCTRPSMTVRKLREELLSDLSSYPHHSSTEGVFILVYDKEYIVTNPVGFEDDLVEVRADLKIGVVVTR